MNRTGWLLSIFGLVCAAQLAFPAYTILRQEQALRRGEPYRFRCEPIDPVDLFRGRYVALGFAGRSLTMGSEPRFERGESIFVRLEHGSDGYARISTPSRTRPEHGDFLEVKVQRLSGDQVTVELPFSRYYMEENAAREADQAYLEQIRRDDVEVYATVRVLRGRAVFEELFVDQLPLRDFLAGATPPGSSR